MLIGLIACCRFEEFDIEASSNGNCEYDYVAFYDGPSTNSRLIGRYCGVTVPDPITTRTNQLTVNFKTDESVAKGGFMAIFTETHGKEVYQQ